MKEEMQRLHIYIPLEIKKAIEENVDKLTVSRLATELFIDYLNKPNGLGAKRRNQIRLRKPGVKKFSSNGGTKKFSD